MICSIENWPTKILLTASWVQHHTSLFQGFETEAELNYSPTFTASKIKNKSRESDNVPPSLDFDDDHCWRWRFLKLEIKREARAPVSCFWQTKRWSKEGMFTAELHHEKDSGETCGQVDIWVIWPCHWHGVNNQPSPWPFINCLLVRRESLLSVHQPRIVKDRKTRTFKNGLHQFCPS